MPPKTLNQHDNEPSYNKAGIGILEPDDERYEDQKEKLVAFIGPSHPFLSVIQVTPMSVEPIIAPSYTLFPGRTESEPIAQALETYRIREHMER